MNLKSCMVLIMIGFLYSASRASIGENFAKAGILIDGSGSFYVNDINSEAQYNFTGSGRLGLFLIDGLLPNIRLGYHYYGSHSLWVHEPFLSVGARWYFGYPRTATKGAAHSIGFSTAGYLGFSGEDRPDFSFDLLPEYTFYFFLTERIAPNLSIEPAFRVYKYPHLIHEWRIGIYINFGFAYFLPTKDQVLIKK